MLLTLLYCRSRIGFQKLIALLMRPKSSRNGQSLRARFGGKRRRAIKRIRIEMERFRRRSKPARTFHVLPASRRPNPQLARRFPKVLICRRCVHEVRVHTIHRENTARTFRVADNPRIDFGAVEASPRGIENLHATIVTLFLGYLRQPGLSPYPILRPATIKNGCSFFGRR
jgi:hypothetical protein